ncbi:hypothetical protein [Burkholderia gladioli]|uniref:hypothetical protein n=1 Tax=Burkholderia gladioli TaxID=28095 RepID=UPI0016405205|nr:hypothetical protein [Burkholderia gladioli]
MAKGNHVFNAFDKVIASVYYSVVGYDEAARKEDMNLIGGAGGDTDAARQKASEAEAMMRKRFVTSYPIYREILDRDEMKWLHATQDDHPVIPNDANSRSFGEESTRFGAEVVDWATGVSNADVMVRWRQLVNLGVDQQAQENYVKEGSSQPGTPNSEDARRARCGKINEFVKGDLTGKVRHLLLAIRFDLKMLKKIKYDPKLSTDWKALLSEGRA